MKVGFIGLGTMGRHMAANLQKAGHELVVFDVRKEASEPHVKNGARLVDSPRAVAEATDVVFTSLPGPVEVESVALDEKQGLLAGLTAGKAFFDLSTNSPTVVRKIHAIFKARRLAREPRFGLEADYRIRRNDELFERARRCLGRPL